MEIHAAYEALDCFVPPLSHTNPTLVLHLQVQCTYFFLFLTRLNPSSYLTTFYSQWEKKEIKYLVYLVL